MRGESGNADRRGHIAETQNLDLFYPGAQAFGDNKRAFGVRLRQNQCKLVAAKPRCGIDAAQFLSETICQSAQRVIAGIMANGIVQLLESVQVEHQEGQRLMQPPGHVQILIKLNLERATVGAASQRVGQRLLLNLREQLCVIHSYRHLIGNGVQQQDLVFVPDPGRVCDRDLQSADRTLMENEWHDCGWKSFGARA